MARRKRRRSIRGGGCIDELPSGRWRLRVTVNGKRVHYGTYVSEALATEAQGRWRSTGQLPTHGLTDEPTDDHRSESWKGGKLNRPSIVRFKK